MIKTLIKIRFQGLFIRSMKYSKGKNASIGKIILMILLFLYVGLVFAFGAGYLFSKIIEPFILIGYEWLYFAIMALLIIMVSFLGSVFVCQQEIYGAKDNELLLSLPIKTKDILLSRVSVILILNYLYEALIAIPAIFVYFNYVGINFIKLLMLLIVLFTLPLVVLSLSCIFGWLMAMIMKKVRNTSLITMVLSIGFILLYFYCINKVPGYISNLIANGKSIGEAINKSLFPIYHLAIAISDTNIISLLIYLLCTFIPFTIVMILLNSNFISLTTNKGQSKKVRFKTTDIKFTNIKLSLLKRELRHFVSNPMVMMNGAIGVIFTVIMAGFMIYKGTNIIDMLGQIPTSYKTMFNTNITPLLCLMIIATSSMNNISSSTVSLEGNRLWIIKSLPIKTKDILESKLLLHLLLCIPSSLLLSIVSSMIFSLGLLDIIIVIIVPIVFILFEALFGLLVNLWKPKFDWVNETVVVKQSMAVMISMFSTMGLVILMVGLYISLLNEVMSVMSYLYIILGLLVIIDVVLYYLLNTWGVKRFEEL